MMTKEQFEELQLHQFHCLTFITIARGKSWQMEKILAILTDSEIDTLTNSFQEMMTSLQQQEGRRSQQWQRFSQKYQVFIKEKQYVQHRRKHPHPSCSSEVKSSFFTNIPLSIVILIIAYDSFHSSFEIFFSIIVLLLVLDALSIYLKWQNKKNPPNFEARLQEGGLWSSVKGIARQIYTSFSTKASSVEQNPGMQDDLQRSLSGILQEEENNEAAEHSQQNTENVQQPSLFRRIHRRLFPQEIELTRPLIN